MRVVSLLMTFVCCLQAQVALARPFACAVLDASTAAGTAMEEICIGHELVVLKPRSRLADNYFYQPRLLGPLLSAWEYELVPVAYQGSAKGALMRIIVQPASGNRNQHLVLSTVGSRVILIGSPNAPTGQHHVRGFIQKELLLY